MTTLPPPPDARHSVQRSLARLLLGPEGARGAHVATGPAAIVLLAALALVAHLLDLATAVRMMATLGPAAELNPIARQLFEDGGALAVAIAKVGVVGGGVVTLLGLAQTGRPRLARNALVAVFWLGFLGFVSNTPV